MIGRPARFRVLACAASFCVTGLWAQAPVTPVAIEAPPSEAKGVVRLQILARVGASSVSTRSLYLFVCAKNPSKCPTYVDFVKRDVGVELQEYLLIKMALEDNSIFKTVSFSEVELSQKTNVFEKQNPGTWRKMQSEVQAQEIELRTLLMEIATFEDLKRKQESIELWVQQLRSRFKVQMLNQNAT